MSSPPELMVRPNVSLALGILTFLVGMLGVLVGGKLVSACAPSAGLARWSGLPACEETVLATDTVVAQAEAAPPPRTRRTPRPRLPVQVEDVLTEESAARLSDLDARMREPRVVHAAPPRLIVPRLRAAEESPGAPSPPDLPDLGRARCRGGGLCAPPWQPQRVAGLRLADHPSAASPDQV